MKMINTYLLRVIRSRVANLLIVLLGISCLSQVALARTAIEIDDDLTLFYETGDLNPVTFAGSVNDVSLVDGNAVIWTADALSLDATGSARGGDWHISRIQFTNLTMEDENFNNTFHSVFHTTIEKRMRRNVTTGRLNRGREPSGRALRWILGGGFDGDFTELMGVYNEDSSVHNVNVVAFLNNPEFAFSGKMKVDSISHTSLTFTTSPQGERILENVVVRMDGFTLENQDETLADETLASELGEFQSLSIDSMSNFGFRFEGEQKFMRFDTDTKVDGLVDLKMNLELATGSDFFDSFEAIANERRNDQANGSVSSAAILEGDQSVIRAALLEALGTISIGNIELAFTDRGFLDVWLDEALVSLQAEYPDGINGRKFDRSQARTYVLDKIQKDLTSSFPVNAARLFAPIDRMFRDGGTLAFRLSPKQPVPVTNLPIHMIAPDLAISGLGISVTHTP